jgi:protein tyrosine phosphatase (PTP) superfamily phosphohydrolase (DUF442 family)
VSLQLSADEQLLNEQDAYKGLHKKTAARAVKANRKYWRLLAVILIVSVGLGIYVWDEVLKERFFAKRFGVVVPEKLFRSGQISPYMIEPVIRDKHLQVVIDLNGLEAGPLKTYQEAEMQACKTAGVDHFRYPLKGDGTGNVKHYVDALEKIQQCMLEGKPVLVHCAAGAQRTGGVVACYQMLFEGKSPAEARSEIEIYEKRVWKNRVMINYVNENMPTICQMLYERKVLAKIPEKFPHMELP